MYELRISKKSTYRPDAVIAGQLAASQLAADRSEAGRSIGQLDESDFGKFLVRESGFSLSATRLRHLSDLSSSEKFIAALLRNDKLVAHKIMSENIDEKTFWESLLVVVKSDSISGLIYLGLMELGLVSQISSATSAFASSALSEIRRLSNFCFVSHQRSEKNFAAVLALTEQYSHHALWFKGAHLCRTVYDEPFTRPFCDLDVMVHSSKIVDFIETLRSADFSFVRSPAHCNQYGVGPLRRSADLFTAPSPGWVASSSLTLMSKEQVSIDIKQAPFQSGLQAVEIERMFVQSQRSECLGRPYFSPSLSDHLLITIASFANNKFRSWKTLYDIFLLSNKLSETPEIWNSFIRTCRIEGQSRAAWIALSMAVERLSARVPSSVLRALWTKQNILSELLSFSVTSSFVWNSTSLPMMLAALLVAEDSRRKRKLLFSSIFPSSGFLQCYYGQPQEHPTVLKTIVHLFMHLVVIFLPAGVVRRTFGKLWWGRAAL